MNNQPIDERWERLLLALQQANAQPEPPKDVERESTLEEDVINSLACELFITNAGQNNRVEMSAFEAYANCKFVRLESDGFGPLVMGIKYGGRTYSYG